MNLDELMTFLRAMPAPPDLGPIRLTRWQWEQLEVRAMHVPADAGPLFGRPVEIVCSVRESTPYTEGWLTCPKCHAPIRDHDDARCGWMPIVGSYGTWVMRADAPSPWGDVITGPLEVAGMIVDIPVDENSPGILAMRRRAATQTADQERNE